MKNANVVVVESAEKMVWLYAHNLGGPEAWARVRMALRKEWRWRDAPYLTRIVYDELVRGFEGTEAGFAISAGPVNPADLKAAPVLVVWPDRRTVSLYEAGWLLRPSFEDAQGCLGTLAFDLFCVLGPEDMPRLAEVMREGHAAFGGPQPLGTAPVLPAPAADTAWGETTEAPPF